MPWFEDRDLREVAVDIEPDVSQGRPPAVARLGAAGQHDTYGSALIGAPSPLSRSA
jgi:hypothetical protein